MTFANACQPQTWAHKWGTGNTPDMHFEFADIDLDGFIAVSGYSNVQN